jgi:CRISPR/Cas system endoribonuclease Cas6 (RAMP superfamily)
MIDPRPGPTAEGTLSVEFITPTAIKQDGVVLRHPAFGALVRRIRDRVNALSSFFGTGPLDLDFAEIGRRADAVRVVADLTRWCELRRRSSRTGQSHELSGLVGRAVFEGSIGEFLPLLHAAELLHVGRHAAFGNGWIRVE